MAPLAAGGAAPPPPAAAATAAAEATASRTTTEASPFLAAATSNAPLSSSTNDDHVEATAIDVAKPLTRSVVSPLYAEDNSSSDDDSDTSFSSRLLDHDGEETFGLQITREVEITSDEFEYLATGEVPALPRPPRAPLLFRAASKRRQRQQLQQEEAAAAAPAAAAAASLTSSSAKLVQRHKHKHLFHPREQQQQQHLGRQRTASCSVVTEPGSTAAAAVGEREGGGGGGGGEGELDFSSSHHHHSSQLGDSYHYSSYYRKQAEHHASAEARRAERRNARGAGLCAPWGRAATSTHEPYQLFDPRVEARATRVFRGRSLFFLPLVHPHSLASRVERLVVSFLDCTYSAFVVPIAIAYIPPKEYSFWSVYALIDIVVGLVFTADIIFALHRAVVVRHHFRRRLLGDGRLIFRAYLLKGTGLLDVVTTLPFWAQSFAILIGAANSPTVVKALLGLRVLRLLRVVPAVSRMFDLSASDIGRSLSGVLSSTALYLGALIYTAAVLVNMLSCLWYFVARVEGAFDDPKTWIDGKRPVTWLSAATLGDAPLAEASKSKIYLAGAYFSVTTLTTVGYGDITPKTSLEHGVAIGVMFVGILFFSFVVNSMGAALASSSAAARRSSALRAKFAEVEAWARARALPPALRRRIMEYYGEVWVRKEEWREADLYGELPAPLRADVTRALALDVFRASDLLASAPEPLLHDLAAAMEPVTVFPGHDLCEQGEEADGLWVMHEGELLLLRDGVPVDIVRAPAMLGECVVLADRLPEAGRRLVTMRAVELCTLWRLPLPRLRLLMERCPEIEEAIVSEFKEHVRKFAARARRAAGKSAKRAAAAAARESEAGGGGGEAGSFGAASNPAAAIVPPPPPPPTSRGGATATSRTKADLDAAVEHGMSSVAEGLDGMLLRLEEAAGIVVAGSTSEKRRRRRRKGPGAASFGAFGRHDGDAADSAASAPTPQSKRPATASAAAAAAADAVDDDDDPSSRFLRPSDSSNVGVSPEEAARRARAAASAALAAADTEAFVAAGGAAGAAGAGGGDDDDNDNDDDSSSFPPPTPAEGPSTAPSTAPSVVVAVAGSVAGEGERERERESTRGGRGGLLGRLRSSLHRGGGSAGGRETPTGGGGSSSAAASVSSERGLGRRSRRGGLGGLGGSSGSLRERSASLPLPSASTIALAAAPALPTHGPIASARSNRRLPSASDVAASHEVLAAALAASLRGARLRHAASLGDRDAERELRGETLVDEYVRLAHEEREERRRRQQQQEQQEQQQEQQQQSQQQSQQQQQHQQQQQRQQQQRQQQHQQ